MKSIKFLPVVLLILASACKKQSEIIPAAKIENLSAVYVPAMVIDGSVVTHNLAMKFTIEMQPSIYYYKVDNGDWIQASWTPGQYIITNVPGDHEIGVKIVFANGATDSASTYLKNI